MSWRGAAACLAAVATATATLVAAGEIKVTPFVDDGRVFASFAAPEAFSADMQSVVRSGLLLTLTYDVELRRPSAVWLDDRLAEVTVASSVRFDSLTGTYQVTKLQDGTVVSSKRTDQPAEVRALLTEFEKVPLATDVALEPNADYYVQVRLQRSPRTTFSLWWLWPWGRSEGSGRASFTFIR